MARQRQSISVLQTLHSLLYILHTFRASSHCQAMTIEHRMDGALGGDREPRKSADEALANLAGTPGAMLALHVQDVVLDLERQLVRIVMGAPASIRQPFHRE